MTQVERVSHKPMLGWYFAPADWRLANGDGRLIEAGVTHEVEGPLVLCDYGLHACAEAMHALSYAPSSNCCRVRLHGEIEVGDDKACATQRTYLAIADVDMVLHEFAAWCAETALQQEVAAGRAVDPHMQHAVAVKQQWLRGTSTGDELAAARDAIWRGPHSRPAVREVVWAAAGTVARAAAQEAAREAAREATMRETGWIAAHTAIWAAQNAQLEAMLQAALGLQD